MMAMLVRSAWSRLVGLRRRHGFGVLVSNRTSSSRQSFGHAAVREVPRASPGELGRWLRFMDELIKGIVVDPNKYPRSHIRKGFGLSEFNKVGNVNLWDQLSNLVSAAYLFIPDMCVKKDDNISFFARRLTLSVLPRYYDTSLVTHPMEYKAYFSYLGSTSFYLALEVHDLTSGVQFMSGDIQCILVDMATKRPRELAQETHRKYGHLATLRTPPERLRFQEQPREESAVFTHRTLIKYSDCDHNGHLMIHTYLRIMFDTGSLAASMGRLCSFQQELVLYKLVDYSVEPVQEIRVGHEVDVVCWENQSLPHTLHFQFQDERGIVCKSMLSFSCDS